MRSRVLIGASAWLLGAVTATTGSMIAVNQLAHGLFGQPVQLLGSAATADTDHDASGLPTASLPAGSPAVSSASPRPSASRHARHTRRAAPAPAQSSSPAAGTLLVSPDGSVMAECLPAGARLLYWSPDQGFQAEDAVPGPAAVASVTFRGAGNTVIMHVSCQAGLPVSHLYWPGGGSGHDD